MARTAHTIALEVDRLLCLALSNYEFELLVEVIMDSENPEQTAINIINCGVDAAFHVINLNKKQ